MALLHPSRVKNSKNPQIHQREWERLMISAMGGRKPTSHPIVSIGACNLHVSVAPYSERKVRNLTFFTIDNTAVREFAVQSSYAIDHYGANFVVPSREQRRLQPFLVHQQTMPIPKVFCSLIIVACTYRNETRARGADHGSLQESEISVRSDPIFTSKKSLFMPFLLMSGGGE
jgi:hypothetical protein